jgi:prepilin-type N-terminal cleavage/methylation domain-containing protein
MRGLTLIELLVVTGIIGALAAMIFPTFAKARERGRQATCISQLRQLGLAMLMYAADNGGIAPRLSAVLPTYCPNAAVFVCPSDRASGQHASSPHMEGADYLSSGVSYTYLPNWPYAWELGWWRRPPRHGEGRWGEDTPLAICHWHWATEWDPDADERAFGVNPKGWMLVLAKGGSVQRVRAETPLVEYAPAGH